MTAKDCIKGRRSIRNFTDKPISHELIEELVATAAYAPSWKNTQITRYIAVEGETKNKIAAECTAAHPNNGKIIESAAVLIAITMIKYRSGYERDGSFSTSKKDGWQMYDAGIASEAFCLAAYEQGIGSVILGIFDYDKASEILEIPDDREIVALIPIGYPAETPTAPKRKSVEDLLSYK